jgi:hypothetical protein
MDREQIAALIDQIISDENSTAAETFNSIVSSKVSDYLDLKKLELAGAIYGGRDE